MANAASSQALEEGKKRLREFLESSDTGRQAMAMSAGGRGDDGGYEMRRMNGGRGGNAKAKMNGVGTDEEEEEVVVVDGEDI